MATVHPDPEVTVLLTARRRPWGNVSFEQNGLRR